MRPPRVVMDSPVFDHHLCFPEAVENLAVEAFVPELAVEGQSPVFGGGLEVGFSRYFERGDSDEEEQVYGQPDHVCAEAGGGRDACA